MILEEISLQLQDGEAQEVKKLVKQAIEEGVPVQDILNKGLLEGMDVIGEQFKENIVFVPEVLLAARAMTQGMALLKPLLAEEGAVATGKVCLGTIKGDLHDIGKNLVKMMMESKGLEVVDLGTNVEPSAFVETAIKENCRIIGVSTLLTTTMVGMADVIKAAEAAGIRDRVKIMIGGAPVTAAFAAQIGADLYTPDATTAAEAAVEFCK